MTADYLCKQFGPRSGQVTFGSETIDTLVTFLKDWVCVCGGGGGGGVQNY